MNMTMIYIDDELLFSLAHLTHLKASGDKTILFFVSGVQEVIDVPL